MDWTAAVEENRQALKRILAALVAMAGLSADPHPEARSLSGSEGEPRRTLPRQLRIAVLRLLRPAEAAARRLIIVAASGLVVTLPPARKAKPCTPEYISPFGQSGPVVTPPVASPKPAARGWRLPIADPLKRFGPRRRGVSVRAMPRIWTLGMERAPLPPPPAPDDPVGAKRLGLRLAALGRALDDLPRQARRLARWRARRDAGLIRRLRPLRPGRPPGWRKPGSYRAQEVHQVLDDLHGLAFWALERPDTS